VSQGVHVSLGNGVEQKKLQRVELFKMVEPLVAEAILYPPPVVGMQIHGTTSWYLKFSEKSVKWK
jgi:hypothetical protein